MIKFCMNIVVAFAFFVMGHSFTEAKEHSVNVGVVLEPPHLDPTAGAAAAIDEIVYTNIFEGLTRINEAGDVEPALASSWDISEDGLRYRFMLEKNVRFHDGADFTAEDVVFSFERAMAEDSVNAQKGLFEAIDTIIINNPHEVTITLHHPSGDFLYNMGWGDAVIVDAASAKHNKTNPNGTGAFRFVEWRKGSSIILNRNEDYWGTQAQLNTVQFQFITDPNAGFAALKAGDVDMIPNFQALELVEALADDSSLTIVNGTTEGETILAINHANPVLNRLEVRQALAHAIPKAILIDGVMSGYGTKIGSHFAPHHPAYVDLSEHIAYDPEAARKKLTEAGITQPLRLRLALPPPAYARRSGEFISGLFNQIGIEVEIIPMEWAIWLEQVFKAKDYDLTIISHTEPMDIGIYARDEYYFNYDNPEFKQLYKEITITHALEERHALYRKAQQMLADDQVNVFLFQLPKVGVWRKALKGAWHNAPIQANVMTDVYWIEE